MLKNRKGTSVAEGTVGEEVSGEEQGQVGLAGHWKNLAFPLIEMGKLLEQCHKNGRLMTEIKWAT